MFGDHEEMYPIHVAAKEGNAMLVCLFAVAYL